MRMQGRGCEDAGMHSHRDVSSIHSKMCGETSDGILKQSTGIK